MTVTSGQIPRALAAFRVCDTALSSPSRGPQHFPSAYTCRGLGAWDHQRQRRSQCGQSGHADAQHERDVTVSGTPQLILNNGGMASYTAGSGSNSLAFTYTLAAGQDTADLEIAPFNPNGGAISDLGGNAASLTNGANTIVGGGTTYNSAAPYQPR